MILKLKDNASRSELVGLGFIYDEKSKSYIWRDDYSDSITINENGKIEVVYHSNYITSVKMTFIEVFVDLATMGLIEKVNAKKE